MNTPKHASLAAKIAGVGMAAAVAVGASAGAAVAAPVVHPAMKANANQRKFDLTQMNVTVRTRGRFLVNPFTRPGKLIGFSGTTVNCTDVAGKTITKLGQLAFTHFGLDSHGFYSDLTFTQGLLFGGKAAHCDAQAGIGGISASGVGQYMNGPSSTVTANFAFDLS